MRIISGKHKSKRIQAPNKLPVRPTTDMAKEALFNILNNHYYLNELSVLDLFSGTGNISYEFGSRGTTNIVAVDAHYGCIRFINETSKTLELDINTIKSDVYKYLENCKTTFDVIFADPPYGFETDQFIKIIELVFKNKLLNEGGLLVIEHSKHTSLESEAKLSYQKKYGGNMFSFFENSEEELE